jgi:hypothetical protein
VSRHTGVAGTVTIAKYKRPTGSGSWQAYELGIDAHGAWLFTPARSTYRGDDGKTVAYCEVAQQSPQGPGRDSVVLMPHKEWWVATWVRGGKLRCTADIATPPVQVGAAWRFDDLELDPFLTRDGTYGVEDEDEFADACTSGLIEATEEAAALRAEDQLRKAFTLDAPLVSAGDAWLLRGIDLALAPLPAPDGVSV